MTLCFTDTPTNANCYVQLGLPPFALWFCIINNSSYRDSGKFPGFTLIWGGGHSIHFVQFVFTHAQRCGSKLYLLLSFSVSFHCFSVLKKTYTHTATVKHSTAVGSAWLQCIAVPSLCGKTNLKSRSPLNKALEPLLHHYLSQCFCFQAFYF